MRFPKKAMKYPLGIFRVGTTTHRTHIIYQACLSMVHKFLLVIRFV